MVKTIKQKVLFKATPHELYELIMDSKKHSLFTGAEAVISRKVSGKFTAHGKYIEGTNLELISDKKIVQKWRGSEWPPGHYSTATFEFKKIPAGTELIFTQENVPDKSYTAINSGWKEHYWHKMKEFLKASKK